MKTLRLILISLVLGIGQVTGSLAATFTVTSTADAVDAKPGDGVCDDGSGNCTLRASIMEANALPGADTITLAADTYTLTFGSQLTINSDLSLNGAGANDTVIQAAVTIDAATHRVFNITSGDVTISGVTIRHGFGDFAVGGGISNQGKLILTNSTVTRNTATEGGDGGGIINYGTLSLINSTVSENIADIGGGILNARGGTLSLINSTVSGNRADFFGGGGGGGIDNWGELTLANSTVSGNEAGTSSGGIASRREGTVVLVNTIIAGNSAPNGPNCSGSFISLGHNLIGNDSHCSFTSARSSTGDLLKMDPLLGPLQNNGGPTLTHALLPGSPAIDAGDNRDAPVTDQRGFPRIVDGDEDDIATIDIGAFEFGGAPPPSIYYVDAVNGDNNNNGLRPKTAFASIQKGIDSAEDGDTVLVYSGLYLGEINFVGKALTVQGVASTAGVPVLQNPGDFAVSFYNGEGPDSVLKNFIIRNSFMGIFIAGSSPTMSNVTVVDNKYGIEAYVNSEPNISNGIFWNNTESDLFGCQARYSCIERGSEGEGNIAADPCFVDPADGDYHLLSERGRYWPEHDVWVLDKVTSPCINGGDPNADASDEPMPNGGRINMGAYAGTAYASMSALNQPPHVRITVPEDGIATSGPLSIEVNAWDRDGYVVKVEFFADGGKIGEDNDINDGWKMAWLDWTEGMHSLSAMATDNDGVVTISPAIEITMLRQQRRR